MNVIIFQGPTDRLQWYTFAQQPMEHGIVVDSDVSHFVHIQHATLAGAIRTLDGLVSKAPCIECGNTVSQAYVASLNGTDYPTVFGLSLEEYESWPLSFLFRDPTGNHRIHYYDGRVENF